MTIVQSSRVFLFFFKDFIYSFETERYRKRERQRQRARAGVKAEGGEADSPVSREPDMGLSPRNQTPLPGPKADA